MNGKSNPARRRYFEQRLLDAIFGKPKRHHMRVRIKDGTPMLGKSLCETCKSAGIARGQNGELVIHCNAEIFNHLRGNVPFKVSECSSFSQINSLDRYQMEAMAWNITARERGPKGFQVPAGEDRMEVIITKPKEKNDNRINWPDE
jgi:hypothetical protein